MFNETNQKGHLEHTAASTAHGAMPFAFETERVTIGGPLKTASASLLASDSTTRLVVVDPRKGSPNFVAVLGEVGRLKQASWRNRKYVSGSR